MTKTKLAQRLTHPAAPSPAAPADDWSPDGVARSEAELTAWDAFAAPPAEISRAVGGADTATPSRYRVISGAVGRWARGAVVSAEDIGGPDRAAALAARGAVEAI